MRLLIIFTYFTFTYGVLAKSHVKTLTESMGQEVIEIGALKELPPGLEEEPSAEADDDLKTTGSSVKPATKRDVKKIVTIVPATSTSKPIKKLQKIDGYHEDEEARVEKELAEIYKDTADYKSENSDEVISADKYAKSATKEATSAVSVSVAATDSTISENSTSTISDYDKPIARQGAKFQPNLDSKADIERFRTSVDDIKCDMRATQKLYVGEEGVPVSNSAILLFADFNILSAAIFFTKSIF